MRERIKPTDTWLSKSKHEIENEDNILLCRTIILEIVNFIKENNLSNTEIAEKLNVSPQYVNKLLHGQILDIDTVSKYKQILLT